MTYDGYKRVRRGLGGLDSIGCLRPWNLRTGLGQQTCFSINNAAHRAEVHRVAVRREYPFNKRQGDRKVRKKTKRNHRGNGGRPECFPRNHEHQSWGNHIREEHENQHAHRFQNKEAERRVKHALTNSKRLFDTLGIEVTLSRKKVKSAYRKLALTLHPDKGGSANSFKALHTCAEKLLANIEDVIRRIPSQDLDAQTN